MTLSAEAALSDSVRPSRHRWDRAFSAASSSARRILVASSVRRFSAADRRLLSIAQARTSTSKIGPTIVMMPHSINSLLAHEIALIGEQMAGVVAASLADIFRFRHL
jgi:hypothetical protein